MRLSIVVPCYNEEAVLNETLTRLTKLLRGLINSAELSSDSEIVFVDDGSRDATWPIIEKAASVDRLIRGLKLSRNRGHQQAVLAGLLNARGDAIISVDADLQDDINAIPEMIKAHAAGAEVVYGVRKQRTTDTFFKRFTAEGYYRLLAWLGVEIVFNHADYRLLGRRAVEALREYREVNLFLRGVIPQLGFMSAIVYYDRAERFAGESKYPLSKMLALAWQGITSFSTMPLRLITGLGATVSLMSIGISLWAIWLRLFTESSVPGWASTVVPLYLLGGVQLLCIGVIGEYLAKTYLETKRRPLFHIEKDTTHLTPHVALSNAYAHPEDKPVV
ncbi:MAG: glycosyltransferase family 2 protein [Thiothrix sp.]|uniref:glycosyltransferase family 2 protein n=1 Tax=Thiothrix sp. TaxID=1032 RepID=UPI00260D6710|nr:glycosyltransferase family 2 protein [Thiothrix sp.]MDD5395603.1 glycosyltransferase family 2 protein [Thiothrix sp.]